MVEVAINPQIKIGMPRLGDRIREARRSAGLSQEKLAEHLDVSWMSIHRWEHDLRTIRYCQLVALAESCGVEIADLVPGLVAEPAEVESTS